MFHTQVVCGAPLRQFKDVIPPPNDGVAGVGGFAVSGVESVEQYAPLWEHMLSGGEVGAEFDCLGLVGEEALHPGAGVLGESRVRQFADQDVTEECIE